MSGLAKTLSQSPSICLSCPTPLSLNSKQRDGSPHMGAAISDSDSKVSAHTGSRSGGWELSEQSLVLESQESAGDWHRLCR